MAIGCLATLPCLAFFLLLQRHLTRGRTSMGHQPHLKIQDRDLGVGEGQAIGKHANEAAVERFGRFRIVLGHAVSFL